MNASKRLNIILAVVSVILLMLLFFSIKPAGMYDDLYFSKALKDSTLLSFLSMRYETWSGRVLIEAILIKTINIKYLPATIITCSFALLAFAMAKIATNDTPSVGCWLIAMILILCCSPSAVQAVFWVTGGYNYLLPFCLGFTSFFGFFKNKKTKPIELTCLTLGFIAANNEMFGAFAILLMLPVIGRKIVRKENVKFETIYFLTLSLSLALCIMAPGNSSRFFIEMSTWMPDFKYYNFLDKITLGVDRLNSGVNQKYNFAYIICCATTALFIYLKKEKVAFDWLILLTILIPVLHICFANLGIQTPLDNIIRGEYMTGKAYDDYGMYLSYSITILIIGGIISYLYIQSKNDFTLYFCASCLLSSVGAVVAIGLSPTVQASGVRIMFILDIAFVMSSLAMLKKIFK
ncbi:DUF6056 family protein [Citrobacter sp. Cf088]|uniref:DUF6056 family protein n=1 Tax=Citrobacter sp. Cf088 TaxID=2985055 RepID=UPI00257831ED|nr:DUF6056 family protein [Citrobacter sp. Cf088]MDM3223323.1 DUF6056 family protein [Citrobacter sp. Cf088]